VFVLNVIVLLMCREK